MGKAELCGKSMGLARNAEDRGTCTKQAGHKGQHKTSSTSPPKAQNLPRGLRIEQAADYSGLSPFYIEELIRNGSLPAIGGPGSGVCAAYIVLREHLDEYLDGLGEQAVDRAEQRRKDAAKAKAA